MTDCRGTKGVGFALALFSAAMFSTSGSLAKSLLDAGWSPAAAVAARVGVAALLLAIPAALSLRGRWSVLRGNTFFLATYGAVAVAGGQVCYFNAVQHISVGVALLLEYLGMVLVVGWLWFRHGQRPRRLTAAGSAVALLGLVGVLDPTGDARLSAVGVLWGLAAAFGLATFFVLSAQADDALPPLVVASGGMTIGAVILFGLGGLGALPMRAAFGTVDFAGQRVSWLIPVLGLSLVAAVLPYIAGITAARMLGAKLASFVGLVEVVFAVVVAWLLLGQMPTPMQLAGGLLIIAGIVLVQMDERVATRALPEVPEDCVPA
jgi:drug/metabolite transporter (DMT)-like permease